MYSILFCFKANFDTIGISRSVYKKRVSYRVIIDNWIISSKVSGQSRTEVRKRILDHTVHQ